MFSKTTEGSLEVKLPTYGQMQQQWSEQKQEQGVVWARCVGGGVGVCHFFLHSFAFPVTRPR